MTPKIINTFISSANRENNEPVHNFTVDFTDDLIKCNSDQYIRVNVISFDMINAMYNIKDTQIVLTGYQNDIPEEQFSLKYICIVPDGNYSVYSFKKWFEEEATGRWYVPYGNEHQFYKATDFFTITKYNISQNTFTFKTIPSIDNLGYIRDYRTYYLNPCKFLGITEAGLIIPYGEEVSGSYVNLVNYNKVILRTNSLNFDVSCIENVRYTNIANKLKFSNILFWCSKQDVEPFRNICYNNSDGGNSFNVMLHDKIVNQMNLQLTNELGEEITDAPDYLLVLQFSIHEKDEWFKKTILEIEEKIKQIFVMMLWVAENYLRIL